MKFEIENSYVLGLASWLSELSLEGKYSRARTRLVKLLADRHTETDKFKKDILDKYSKKDSDGNPLIVDGNYQIDDREAFSKEIQELYKDTFTANLDKNDAVWLKEVVLNTDYKFGPKENDSEQEKNAKIRQANDYSEWCKSFENITK